LDTLPGQIDGTADRKPSIARLATALQDQLGAAAPHPLVLPASLLFASHLRFDSADPGWSDRDRLLFAAELAPFSAGLATLAGLPAGCGIAPGCTLGAALGMVLAERLLAARFGRSLVDHRCWVFADGAGLASGPMQEAALLAGMWRLGRLTAIVAVAAQDAPGLAGFAAAGWSVRRVDSSEAGDVAAALSAALRSQKPTLIACLSKAPPARALHTPSEEGRLAWAATGRRDAGMRRAWLRRLARHASRQDYEAAMAGRLPVGWHRALVEPGPLLPPGQTQISTAETLRLAWMRLPSSLPDLVSLPGAAGWKLPGAQTEFCHARDAAGRLPQGIGAAMAGMALHGGFLPVATHSLSELDHLRPGLRAAAAAGLHFVECLVEPARPCPSAGYRASLRAMRNLLVFRPADASVPLLAERPARTRCAKGGYVFREAGPRRAVTLVASGPELHLALQAVPLLAAAGVPASIVSMPCWDLFAQQEPEWQHAVLGDAPIVAIEIGSGFGWERFFGHDGLFIGNGHATGDEPPLSPHGVAQRVLRHLCIPQLA
jgi:transketolase